MSKELRTAVVGVTGYAGAELARLLLRHPRLEGAAPVFAGRSEHGVSLGELHPALRGIGDVAEQKIQPFAWDLLADAGVEAVFLATPHELSREVVPEALARGLQVIDLSGAWRLEARENRTVYGFEDEGTDRAVATQVEAVYGMPELHRDAIAGARLVANPGCYATAVILALKPLLTAGLVDLSCGIVADAKSGVSGAGKTPVAKTHFMYAADNLSAYGVFSHRHTGELLEQLGIESDAITFTPHLLPIPRGILSTIYVRFYEAQTAEAIGGCYSDFFSA